MKKIAFLTIILSISFHSLFSQTDEKLKSDIRSTGYVHSPLPLDYSKSFETTGLLKKVTASEMLCDMEDLKKWSHEGIGGMRLTDERSRSGKYSLRLVAPTVLDQFLGWGV